MNLYHIHRYKDPKDDYNIGEILDVTKPNKLRQEQLRYTGSYLEKSIERDGETFDIFSSISSMFKPGMLDGKSDEEINKMMALMDEYIHNEGILRREMILEEIRREKYIHLPSRYNCMWLTDEECIDSWLKLLYAEEGHYSIFEMQLDGNVFCSTDELLPNTAGVIQDMYDQANNYWNPSKEEIEHSIKREYLFEGKAKILRKVN